MLKITGSARRISRAEMEKRINELELEKESALLDPQDASREEYLRSSICGLLGKNNLHLLREYTDRLIARYNTDAGWFYRKGFEDAVKWVKS